MHKSAVRSFAVYARRALIDAITQRAQHFGITEHCIVDPLCPMTPQEQSQRLALIGQIRENGFTSTIEDIAYTCFHHLTALRYLEVNGYLATCCASQDSSRMLALCRWLHREIPEAFDEFDAGAKLLFPSSLLDVLLTQIASDIPEEDWHGQVQILGWLYQYYHSEPKKQILAEIKPNIRLRPEQIPAVTQLFTPDWIVHYLVQNTLGRLWTASHGIPSGANWQYLLPRTEISASCKLRPEKIRFIDPCMGAGNMLAYAFDVLMEMYLDSGWSARDAAVSILRNNLCGLDIDRRVYQLCWFSLLMKARRYAPDILCEVHRLNLACFADIADDIPHAETLGSLLEYPCEGLSGKALTISQIMTQKYDVVVTNPPYMGIAGMEQTLAEFVRKRYPLYKSDLFSVFMVRCMELAKPGGYLGLLTPYVWMFLRSYKKLRELIYSTQTIDSLIQFEYSAFEEATVPVCSFVMQNCRQERKGCYFRLTAFRGGMEVQRRKLLDAIRDPGCGYYFEAAAAQFALIPEKPAAYWLPQRMLSSFQEGSPLKTHGDTRQGMATSDNKRFLRLWFEVVQEKLGIGFPDAASAKVSRKKWFPYNKGGDFRKWYGNIGYVVNYENDGAEIKAYAASLYRAPTRSIKSISEYFKPCLSWSKISSGRIAFRYYPCGFVFDVAGCCIFYEDEGIMHYDFGFVNSCVAHCILEALSPTMNFEAGHVASLPILRDDTKTREIRSLTEENIRLCCEDWNVSETSWDFVRHPLL